MKENTVYATVQPAVLPQYENVVMKENNEFAVVQLMLQCHLILKTLQ